MHKLDLPCKTPIQPPRLTSPGTGRITPKNSEADRRIALPFRSPEAERKPRRKRTRAGEPRHSWPTLLRHLALRCRTTIRLAGTDGNFDRLTEPTPVQARALELARTAELPP